MLQFHAFPAFLAEAAAPAGPGGTQPTAPWWVQMFPILLMFVVFYLLLLRPQQKKAKEHAAMLKTLRPGDKVVTSGGVVGVVISVKERTVVVRSNDTKLEVTKGSVTEVTERSGETPSES